MLEGRAEIKSSFPAPNGSETAGSIWKFLNPGLTILFGIIAALFFILAVIGTVRNYSPVPWLDMWDDYIGFYLKIHAGDWSAWWAQHNEHRIVLARLFFWIDITCFHGDGIFSLVVIYMFAFAVGLIFAKIWQEQSQGQDLYILFFVEAWIFSWSQRENFTWGFQSQFILAQLLPLAALYFLHSSIAKPHRARVYFWVATICGVLAVGSMANGVLALPAMALYAAIAARNSRQAAFFVVLSVIELCLYFQNLNGSQLPGAAPSIAAEIFQHPAGFVAFCLTYFGSPFIFLFGSAGLVPEAMLAGQILAGIIAPLCAWALYKNLKNTARPSLPLALLVFIFYIMATAAITAAGRLPLGLQAARASRYLTPALYGWAAALLLFWPAIARSNTNRTVFSILLAVFLCFVMLPRQVQALTNKREMLFQRELAALALELQINDAQQLRLLYPRPEIALRFAAAAREQHLSVFGFPPLENVHLLLGQKTQTEPSGLCRGGVTSISAIPGAPQYGRIEGWLYNDRLTPAPELVILTDAADEIVGVGLLGSPRSEIADSLGSNAMYSGFEAYLSMKAHGQRISILSPDNHCKFTAAAGRFN